MADRLSQCAIDLGFEDSAVFTTRAEVLKNLGNFEASLQAFEEAKIRFPNSDYAWVGIADVLREMGLYERSLEAYIDAQQHFPDESVPFNGYVSVLRSQGAYDKAIRYALSVVDRFPEDPVSRTNLAGALRDRGKYGGAVRQYEAALQLDGTNPKAILGYVYTLVSKGERVQRAIDFLDDRLRILPGNAPLIVAKANYLRRAGRLPESLSLTEQLMEDQPSYSPAKFSSAATLVAMGEIESAKRILPQMERLRSETDWLGFQVYVVALIAESHLDRACELLQTAIQTCPWKRQSVRLQTLMGYVQAKLGNLTQAIERLEQDLPVLDDRSRQLRFILLGRTQVFFSGKNASGKTSGHERPHFSLISEPITYFLE